MTETTCNWLLLVTSLPSAGATARMRLWRAIKALGCVALRDGAYILPASDEHATALAELATTTHADGGQALVADIAPRSADDHTAFVTLFDRSGDYADLVLQLNQARKGFASQSAAEVSRAVKRFRKDLDAIERVDFFPNEASLGAQAAWSDLQDAANAVLSPGEPHADQRPIPQLATADYQGRTWATRRHLWVDRVASAWLIHRFIDHDARFLWLDSPRDCPSHALGFDFDDAAFTHVEDKVTFEVLLASFGLDDNPALFKLASVVHALDVGGTDAPEALGFEAILSGARARLPDDNALLAEIDTVLDSLYAHFEKRG
jgi:hypothetical protein